MPFQMAVDVCAALTPFLLLAIWIGAVLTALSIINVLRRCPRAIRAAFLVVVLFVGNASPAVAGVPMPEHCQYMNNNQWPCWVIEALWCPCYWNSPAPPDGF